MICPYCQYDLDDAEMACTNCGASYPRHRAGLLGIRLRLLALGGGMLLVSTLILVECVLPYLPGGAKSGYRAPGSPQVSISPRPDMKSADLQRLLQQWRQGQQPTQNLPAAPPH